MVEALFISGILAEDEAEDANSIDSIQIAPLNAYSQMGNVE